MKKDNLQKGGIIIYKTSKNEVGLEKQCAINAHCKFV